MSKLFSPLRIRDLEIANRAWVSPMCQYSAVDGVVEEWHRIHLGSFVLGGAGLVMAEASAVVAEGRISVACPGLWNDEQVQAWSKVTAFAHTHGAKMGIQLAHAGRKASTLRPWDDHVIAEVSEGGWTAQAPSALAFEGYPVPHELNVHEIDSVVDAFAAAARRAVAAGFDVLEVHGAHGYLLHQFLSPLSNVRSDQYGGRFENRTRLMLRVVDAVRAAMPEPMPLFVRISATDYAPGGWDLEQSVELCRLLKEHGVDLIDVSSGGNVHGVRIELRPGYQVDFASTIRERAQVMTSAVGLITGSVQAETILVEGKSDAVMLARAFLRNPHWASHAAEELGDFITWPAQYERARTLHRP